VATEAQPVLTFGYRAISPDGKPISGTIDAVSITDAAKQLASLRLTGVQMEQGNSPPKARALRGDDFFAFNQQLAQLTAAGLPVEQGLRLIAAELRRGPMKRTLEMVASDLESGKTLPQAIDAHRNQFPALYGHLVDAGIRAGNLPRILLNLGRHLTLVRRLQATLWRTFSYPIVVLCAFCAMTFFILMRVIPQFQDSFHEFGARLPVLTQIVMNTSVFVNQQAGAIIAGMVGLLALGALILYLVGRERSFAEMILLKLPLIGPILRRNLISRWCDAVGLGVEAGMDLPAAISMADDAIGSSGLKSDGQAIVSAVSAGRPITAAHTGRILPPMVVAAIDLSSKSNELPRGLATLSHLYEQQAELRLGAVEVVLTPLVIVLIGLMIGTMSLAVFSPIISLIDAISGPIHFK
jgi:type IV pilus assembly protein PilC